MATSHCDQSDNFTQFLGALLGDAAAPTSPCWELPAPASALQTSSHSTKSSHLPSEQKLKATGVSRSKDWKGNKGLRRQVQQLEQSLHQQRQELRQQVHRKLYLTERAALLEQLVTLHEQHQARCIQLHSGLTHNPFAAWNCTVEEATNIKPAQWSRKHNYIVQCLAQRLSIITPLLQKYPQLAVHRPPTEKLQQLVRELSLAEPTNPYGADGLPVGSLTVPVPAKVLHMFAAMYGIDISSMCAAERSLLESCAVLVVEQMCLSQGLVYSPLGCGFMLPRPYRTRPIHVGELAAYDTWESYFTSLRVMEGPNQGDAAANAADESLFHDVVAHMELTDKQKLESAIVLDVFNAAKAAVLRKRATLAHALLSLAGASTQVTTGISSPRHSTANNKPSNARQLGPPSAAAQQQQQQQQAAQSDTYASVQRECSPVDDATAVYRLTPEQLTQQQILMRRLENYTAQELSLIALFAPALHSLILSPVQMVKYTVHSYPYRICRLTILSACAAACTPEVMDVLAAAAPTHGHHP